MLRSGYLVTAEEIALALRGKRSGKSWTARCPAHEDSTPSLTIAAVEDGKPLVYCHAGCPQAQVIEALKQRGLWAGATGYDRRLYRPRPIVIPPSRAPDTEWRTQFWWQIWRKARAVDGTPGELYLRSRDITILPRSLRFGAATLYVEGSIRLRLPALIALVQNVDGLPIGVQRTYLLPDGSDKADVAAPKKILGQLKGGAVRLATASEKLLLAEGLEDALSVQQATWLPSWATLGTAGLAAVELPECVHEIVICADNDDAGERAAKTAAARFRWEGRNVRIAKPNGVKDFNDLLRA